MAHHDTTDEADASPAVSIGNNVPISDAQEGDGNKPEAVQNVVKLLVMMPLIQWYRQCYLDNSFAWWQLP